MDEFYKDKDGNERTIRESFISGLYWITNRIETSDAGLLEFYRDNPRLIKNQYWKDGRTAIIHTDGMFPNYEQPVAALQVQGLAYDALTKATRLLQEALPKYAEKWHSMAQDLREKTLKLFWMPEQQYFAMALDREEGRLRQITTIGSDPGALLDPGIFDDLAEKERQLYITNIVRRIFSDELLSEGGILCRSRQYTDVMGYADYQGSQTTWIKETSDIRRGLKRQGFTELADELGARMLNLVNRTQSNAEFAYDIDGSVIFDPKELQPTTAPRRIVAGTNIPEGKQAWSTTAVYAYKRELASQAKHETQNKKPEPWQQQVTGEILERIGRTKILKTKEEIIAALPKDKAYRIDTRLGKEKEARFVKTHTHR